MVLLATSAQVGDFMRACSNGAARPLRKSEPERTLAARSADQPQGSSWFS
jgi:hypothetical protein